MWFNFGFDIGRYIALAPLHLRKCVLWKLIVFKLFFVSIGLLPTSSNAQEDFSIGSQPGHPVASFKVPLSGDEGDLRIIFDFGATRGFLGPSTRPSSQNGFSNADRTLFAVNNAPLTKSSYVHLFLRSPQGDFLFLNDVNGRIASLLKGRFSNSAKYFLRVESVEGRKLRLQTVDFAADYVGLNGGQFQAAVLTGCRACNCWVRPPYLCVQEN